MLMNHYPYFKSSLDPWNIVEKHWSKITRFGQKLQKPNVQNKCLNSNSEKTLVSNYMNKYPALQKPTGYHLVKF